MECPYTFQCSKTFVAISSFFPLGLSASLRISTSPLEPSYPSSAFVLPFLGKLSAEKELSKVRIWSLLHKMARLKKERQVSNALFLFQTINSCYDISIMLNGTLPRPAQEKRKHLSD